MSDSKKFITIKNTNPALTTSFNDGNLTVNLSNQQTLWNFDTEGEHIEYYKIQDNTYQTPWFDFLSSTADLNKPYIDINKYSTANSNGIAYDCLQIGSLPKIDLMSKYNPSNNSLITGTTPHSLSDYCVTDYFYRQEVVAFNSEISKLKERVSAVENNISSQQNLDTNKKNSGSQKQRLINNLYKLVYGMAKDYCKHLPGNENNTAKKLATSCGLGVDTIKKYLEHGKEQYDLDVE